MGCIKLFDDKKLNDFLCLFVRKNIGYILGVISILALLLIVIVVRINLLEVIIVLGLVILGCLSSQIKRLTGNINFGLDFYLFSSVLIYYSSGFIVGFVSTLIMITISNLLIGEFSMEYISYIFTFFIIGMIYPFLGYSIELNGMILALVFNVFSAIFSYFLGLDMFRNASYFIGSLLFNYFLFMTFGGIIYSLM